MDPEESVEQRAEGADAGEVALEFLREVVAAMHMSADVEIEQEEDGTYRLELVGEDAGELIGRYGDTLNSLQYLATLVTQKYTGEHVRLLLDAEGYRDRREAALVEQARSLAAEVIQSGQEVELDPLGSFERRIIHNALLDHPDVVTYSEGEEPERYVVIGPRKK
jgi:spoIIIJ-associated protein